MPQVYFADNYCFEITNTCITVSKYDFFDHTYYKIDQCPLQKIPQKYKHILEDIKHCDKAAADLIAPLQQIQISS
jgi:hypothetical protein